MTGEELYNQTISDLDSDAIQRTPPLWSELVRGGGLRAAMERHIENIRQAEEIAIQRGRRTEEMFLDSMTLEEAQKVREVYLSNPTWSGLAAYCFSDMNGFWTPAWNQITGRDIEERASQLLGENLYEMAGA